MAWEEIVDFTVPSNTTSVTFNNFGTITKDDFIKIFITNTSNHAWQTFPNNQTTETNYHVQAIAGEGSNVNAFRANINANQWSSNPAHLYGYMKLSENDRFNVFYNSNDPGTSSLRTALFVLTSSGVTFPNGITSLTFTGRGGNIFANSRIQIYRLTAEKVADVTVTSNTTQVDITGLDIKKGDEYLLVSNVFNSTSSGNNYYRLFVNNNTTNSNYYSQEMFGAGTSHSGNRTNEPRYLVSTGQNTSVAYSHIKLSNIGVYTSQNYCLLRSGTNLPTLTNFFISSTVENITSLTQLNIQSDGSNAIGTGTRFQLYKLYEGGN